MNKKVIYTAIFGDKDVLHDPDFLPEGFDFVCFTDNRDFRSSIWKVVYVDRPFEDPVRSARYYKIMAHKVVSEYEYSIWIDGNMIVTGDLNLMINKYLDEVNLAVYKHGNLKRRIWKIFWVKDRSFARSCVYAEAQELLNRNSKGQYMDDPDLIKKQMNKYRKEGYPENNGLAVTMVLLRKHNEKDVIRVMEDWWYELSNNSRRDQLSFNYVAWKNKFNFRYIKGDPRYNKFFSKVRHFNKENYILKK